MSPSIAALAGLPGFSTGPFAATSRYNGIAQATLQTPNGPVAYVTRRFLPCEPPPGALPVHTVRQGERLDTLAAQLLGDPTQFWRICDANDALRPQDLTALPGSVLRIPTASGIASS